MRRLVLPLLAAALVGWAATTLVAVARWSGPDLVATGIVLLAALVPLIVVLAIPVIGLALRSRRWVSAGAAALAAVAPWGFVLSYAAPAQRPPGTATTRVLLVNADGGKVDPAAVVAAVVEHRPDVLVVTELTVTLAHDLAARGLGGEVVARWVVLPGVDLPATDQDAGIGVWTRWSFAGQQAVPGTSRPAITARIGADDASFVLVAGHVPAPHLVGARRWAADLAALRAAADPALGARVVVGTLNATPWHADFRAVTGQRLVDAADAQGEGLRPTWPTWLPLPVLPLDHVLVGGGIGVDDVETVVLAGTDHRSLLVSLQVPRTAARNG